MPAQSNSRLGRRSDSEHVILDNPCVDGLIAMNERTSAGRLDLREADLAGVTERFPEGGYVLGI